MNQTFPALFSSVSTNLWFDSSEKEKDNYQHLELQNLTQAFPVCACCKQEKLQGSRRRGWICKTEKRTFSWEMLGFITHVQLCTKKEKEHFTSTGSFWHCRWHLMTFSSPKLCRLCYSVSKQPALGGVSGAKQHFTFSFRAPGGSLLLLGTNLFLS